MSPLGEPPVSQEIQRRQGNTAKVLDLFRARPNQWIRATEFIDIGGLLAWRTRIADARKIVKKEGGAIENRQVKRYDVCGVSFHASEYRYLIHAPLGRDSSVPSPDAWPAFDAPIQETFRLT